ncbi:hypothetical protein CAK95_21040 [Pseudorhodoplanes sinuspersici]|uniref:Uncharacterized protein n=1 Tax=Pseudorhodoplanes sinuspersici TaxID=1235591 RepID=A0A1W6ZVB2_9HYPH|nr:hypothetical protein CAK95_21040 [Pseudorhodoplanes sinuspersici]
MRDRILLPQGLSERGHHVNWRPGRLRCGQAYQATQNAASPLIRSAHQIVGVGALTEDEKLQLADSERCNFAGGR